MTSFFALIYSRMVERFERRILEEFSKMFNDSNSFYFSLTGDVTNSLQRQVARPPIMSTNAATGEQIELFPTWREVDERFFFNKAMVQELIEIGDQRLDAWITPFIQVSPVLFAGRIINEELLILLAFFFLSFRAMWRSKSVLSVFRIRSLMVWKQEASSMPSCQTFTPSFLSRGEVDIERVKTDKTINKTSREELLDL